MKKNLLFSVTSKDCVFSTYKGSGAGGQKKNKTSSAVRCLHVESGAVGECEEFREQSQNKKQAFIKMTKTTEFQKYMELRIRRETGQLAVIEEKIEKEMKKIKIEIKEDGKWKETDMLS